MILNEKYTLSNGVGIPKLGLGTWRIPDKQTVEAVRTAVSIEYRPGHTATSQASASCGNSVRKKRQKSFGEHSEE